MCARMVENNGTEDKFGRSVEWFYRKWKKKKIQDKWDILILKHQLKE